MLKAQPSVSLGSGKHPLLTPPLLGSSCFLLLWRGFLGQPVAAIAHGWA